MCQFCSGQLDSSQRQPKNAKESTLLSDIAPTKHPATTRDSSGLSREGSFTQKPAPGVGALIGEAPKARARALRSLFARYRDPHLQRPTINIQNPFVIH